MCHYYYYFCVTIIIIFVSLLLLNWKNKIGYKITFATAQAPAPRKIEQQTQGSNLRFTAPLNPFNFLVSNTV